jgi:hypothetical protein
MTGAGADRVKLVHVSFHFEYTDAIERLLDRHEIVDFVRYSMIEGRDRDGKHFGTQVYPGSVVVVQAHVAAERVEALLDDLRRFRDEKPAHGHLRAVVLPVEQRL